MPQHPEEYAADVDAHLLKEALAAGAVAGALFAGTAQAQTASESAAQRPAAAEVHAAGATIIWDGGTAAERLQVTKALAASSFDWSRLPPITVHITDNPLVEATAGDVWIESSLLHSGRFAWGVVQHEFAHQVDYFLLNDADRAQLSQLLGGTVWCEDDAAGLKHSDYTCERFASTLAWAYWQSPDNCMKPQGRGDVESGSVAPAVFRAVLSS